MRKGRFTSNERPLEEPLINLTPLIDVVFVVLITFMLIAPILHLDHVDLAESSHAHSAESAKTSSLSIQVKADNTIWFRGQKLSSKELEKVLKQEKKQHPKEIPQVIQDRKAEFGTYQMVKNTLETCGFEQMDVVLSPAKQ